MLAPLHVHLPDARATQSLGERLAAMLQAGQSLHLSGDLGSGKTTLARGIIFAFGFSGPVKSPTYTLVEPYVDSRLSFYHFDFFRFRHPSEWHEAGFRECFNERSICVVEWPEKAAGLVPEPDLHIRLAIASDGGRDATIEAMTAAGRSHLTELARQFSAR
jgi:tRNA threonylcarbamoyladenosine biosynthesis protein TsaE